ncbi:MAG: Acetyltransferase (isoleucine patch superfamily) [Verrucomicrobia bacterium]|jgi:acetyltransferase-like isoleucine patch superfamily enzyme|nr:MAG: Acetyltransferase (isoleucine patch superfamily) [Verrucomicrobiota bacterium]
MPLDRHHAFAVGETAPLKKRVVVRTWKERLLRKMVGHVRRLIRVMESEEAVESFQNGAELGKGCVIGAAAWCANYGSREHITLGQNVICRGILRIERWRHGTLRIGDDVYLGDDTVISCADRVEIGSLTMIAHGVQIFDNDSHPLDPSLREQDYLALLGRHQAPRPAIPHEPVVIGDHVWIGMNSLILKGAVIGRGSVVAAGSVVTGEIPPMSVAAGVPARVIASLQKEEIPGAETGLPGVSP